jgi:hypothetical protein
MAWSLGADVGKIAGPSKTTARPSLKQVGIEKPDTIIISCQI